MKKVLVTGADGFNLLIYPSKKMKFCYSLSMIKYHQNYRRYSSQKINATLVASKGSRHQTR